MFDIIDQIALAPDGQRVVSEEIDPRVGSALFVIELTRPIHARLTTGDDAESDPDLVARQP